MAINYTEALQRATDLCSRSEKSLFDVRQSLSRWGFSSPEGIQKIEAYLVENDFVNELRYSRCFVSDKYRFNKWGIVKLRAILKTKGIDENIIDKAIDGIDRDLYQSILRDELLKKRSSVKATNNFELRGKLMRFAQSRGYETDLIFKMLDEIPDSDSFGDNLT